MACLQPSPGSCRGGVKLRVLPVRSAHPAEVSESSLNGPEVMHTIYTEDGFLIDKASIGFCTSLFSLGKLCLAIFNYACSLCARSVLLLRFDKVSKYLD